MRYILQRVPAGTIDHPELPLTGVSLTDALSGPRALNGTVPPSLGIEILEKGHAIWAEEDGVIRGGGIVDRVTGDGAVECVGFSGMLQGQPYDGEGKVWSKVDPLDVVREIWAHWQSFPEGNLGVRVGSTTSPVRIGEEQYIPLDVTLSEADTTFDDGPIRLNFYDTHNLGGMIDDFVRQGFFDYHERTELIDGELVHFLDLYYPRKGVRREALRFVVGENVTKIPELAVSDDGIATEVMFLGAGEGRAKVRARATALTGRVRHVAIVTDDTVKRQTDANERARREAARRQGFREVTSLTVRDHPNARVGSLEVGDQIYVQGTELFAPGDSDQWVRILAVETSPAATEATLTVGSVE